MGHQYRLLLRALAGHSGWVEATAVTTDGRWALTGSADKTAKLWDLATGQCRQTFSGHTGSVSAVAVTPTASGS